MIRCFTVGITKYQTPNVCLSTRVFAIYVSKDLQVVDLNLIRQRRSQPDPGFRFSNMHFKFLFLLAVTGYHDNLNIQTRKKPLNTTRMTPALKTMISLLMKTS